MKVARELLGKEALIGLSTHNQDQFLEAQSQDIDYIAIGPVFSTSTKEGGNPPLGVETMSRLIAESRYPVVAIGGISLNNAAQVWAAGADSVAVISDIVNAPNPAKRVSQYLALGQESH